MLVCWQWGMSLFPPDSAQVDNDMMSDNTALNNDFPLSVTAKLHLGGFKIVWVQQNLIV